MLPGLAVAGAPVSEPFPASATKTEPPPAAGLPPWQSEAAARERPRAEPPPEPEAPTPPAAPEAPRRRNLLFASSSRKERERAEAKTGEGLPPLPHVEPRGAGRPGESAGELRRCLAEAGPYAATGAAGRRAAPPPRSPSTFTEAAPPPAPEHPTAAAEQAPVTVLKSGVVDGMAYSLYSDGSIEAQMPEGMMRFASIDELRSHLDQRALEDSQANLASSKSAKASRALAFLSLRQ